MLFLPFALLPVATALRLQTQYDDSKQRPVTKVINLLKSMQEQLQKDGKTDTETYEKFQCWCTTNEKEKKASIKAAQEQIVQLQANIEEFISTEARLDQEIKDLEEEIDKNQKALDQATAIRNKEIAENNEEEKEMIKSVRALESAVISLSKHHDALIQNPEIAKTISELLKHKAPVSTIQRKHLTAFLQAPGGFQSHAAQSGQIYGILKQMLDNFKANLSQSQRDELEAQRIFAELKKSKMELIKAGQDQVNKKTEHLADTRVALAEARETLKDTQASLEADQSYLADLVTRCGNMDKEWDQRQKARAEELVAIGEALKILSSDDAHDTFTGTFNNFLQIENDDKRTAAQKVLNAAASKFHRPGFAGLALAVRLDAFTKVKKAIDDMIAQLNKEKADEIKHKDWCNESFHTNLMETEHSQRNVDEQIAAIDDLDADVKQLSSEMQVLKDEIAEIHTQVQKAGETRSTQNEAYKATVTEQREAQAVLKRVITVLKNVYERKEKQRFALDQEPVGPPPPEGFKVYKKNESSGGVIGMIQQIMHQAQRLEDEATRDERDSQEGYESFIKEARRSTDIKTKEIINKKEFKATKQQEKTERTVVLDTENSKLKSLGGAKTDLHQSCDFVIKNFDIRQDARIEEIEALRQAKAILSGLSADFIKKN